MIKETLLKNNKTKMEDGIMKDYTKMKWVELVAYAKEMGINTRHKKRFQIELELDGIYDKIADALTEGIDVPVGDTSTDKYYPELQKEEDIKEDVVTVDAKIDQKKLMEQNIIAAIKRASFNATYNNIPVVYVMTKSLQTIVKYNLAEHLRTEDNITKVIKGLVKNNILYPCNKRFYGVR